MRQFSIATVAFVFAQLAFESQSPGEFRLVNNSPNAIEVTVMYTSTGWDQGWRYAAPKKVNPGDTYMVEWGNVDQSKKYFISMKEVSTSKFIRIKEDCSRTLDAEYVSKLPLFKSSFRILSNPKFVELINSKQFDRLRTYDAHHRIPKTLEYAPAFSIQPSNSKSSRFRLTVEKSMGLEGVFLDRNLAVLDRSPSRLNVRP